MLIFWFQTETKKYAVDPDKNYTAVDLEFDFFLTVVDTDWSNEEGQHKYTYYAKEEIKQYIAFKLKQETFSYIKSHEPEVIDMDDCTDE